MSGPSPSPVRDDLALIDAVQQRDEAALGVLYDRHSPAILGLIMRMLPERDDAEGVLLEVFTQVWRDAARYTPERGPVLGWLVTIARSRALDSIRASGRRARLGSVSMDDAPPAALEAHDAPSNPSFGVEERERQATVAAAVRALPEAQRTAIELAFFEGLSHSEIAERLAEPLGTIKTRIRLGMIKLRDALQPVGRELLT